MHVLGWFVFKSGVMGKFIGFTRTPLPEASYVRACLQMNTLLSSDQLCSHVRLPLTLAMCAVPPPIKWCVLECGFQEMGAAKKTSSGSWICPCK